MIFRKVFFIWVSKKITPTNFNKAIHGREAETIA